MQIKRNYITLIFCVVLTNLVASTKIQLNEIPNSQIHKSSLSPENARKQAATSAPNFIQLVIMRLIYGIASTIGVEDRLEDTFNGAFVPPNADGGLLDFGGAGGDDSEGGLFGDIFDGGDYL